MMVKRLWFGGCKFKHGNTVADILNFATVNDLCILICEKRI